MTPEELIREFRKLVEAELDDRKQVVIEANFQTLADVKWHCGYITGYADCLHFLEEFYKEKKYKDEQSD